jgi:hypothetical protein
MIAQTVCRKHKGIGVTGLRDLVTPNLFAENVSFKACPAGIVKNRIDLVGTLVRHCKDVFDPRASEINEYPLDQRNVGYRNSNSRDAVENTFSVNE